MQIDRWYEYAMLDDRMATMLFIAHYGKASMRWNERAQGTGYINTLRGFDVEHPEKWHWWRHAENLRAWADTWPMRYDHFWRWAFAARDALNFKRKTFNIFSNTSIKAKVTESFKEYCKEYVYVADSDSLPFRAESYRPNCPILTLYWRNVGKEIVKKRGQLALVAMLNDGDFPLNYNAKGAQIYAGKN